MSYQCPRCHSERYQRERKANNLCIFCADCGRFITNERQAPNPEAYEIPIGKYRGRILAEVLLTDRPHIEWLASSCAQLNIRRRCAEALEQLEENQPDA